MIIEGSWPDVDPKNYTCHVHIFIIRLPKVSQSHFVSSQMQVKVACKLNLGP